MKQTVTIILGIDADGAWFVPMQSNYHYPDNAERLPEEAVVNLGEVATYVRIVADVDLPRVQEYRATVSGEVSR